MSSSTTNKSIYESNEFKSLNDFRSLYQFYYTPIVQTEYDLGTVGIFETYEEALLETLKYINRIQPITDKIIQHILSGEVELLPWKERVELFLFKKELGKGRINESKEDRKQKKNELKWYCTISKVESPSTRRDLKREEEEEDDEEYEELEQKWGKETNTEKLKKAYDDLQQRKMVTLELGEEKCDTLLNEAKEKVAIARHGINAYHTFRINYEKEMVALDIKSDIIKHRLNLLDSKRITAKMTDLLDSKQTKCKLEQKYGGDNKDLITGKINILRKRINSIRQIGNVLTLRGSKNGIDRLLFLDQYDSYKFLDRLIIDLYQAVVKANSRSLLDM